MVSGVRLKMGKKMLFDKYPRDCSKVFFLPIFSLRPITARIRVSHYQFALL